MSKLGKAVSDPFESKHKVLAVEILFRKECVLLFG